MLIRKTFNWFLLTVLLFGASLYAQERITLTTSVTKVVTDYQFTLVILDIEKQRVYVELRSNINTEPKINHSWTPTTTPTGLQIIRNINTNNGTQETVERAILKQLIKEGVIIGSVTGTPR
jgi:hypothetical protein